MVYRDYRGYQREEKEHTDLVHRNRAYHIYLQNRRRYPFPYSAYEVHHIDFDKNNNKVSNLQIVTPTEHDRIHEEKERQEGKKKQQGEEDKHERTQREKETFLQEREKELNKFYTNMEEKEKQQLDREELKKLKKKWYFIKLWKRKKGEIK